MFFLCDWAPDQNFLSLPFLLRGLMLKKLFVLMNLTLLSSAQDSCLSWFAKAKLESDPQCLIKCSALITNMSTFRCPERCTELCEKDSLVNRLLGKAAYYPGLTSEERKLISQYPKEALKVFLAKQKAETLTAKRFKRDAEGDAEKLRKGGTLDEELIENEALNALKEGTLIILKPKGGPR